MEHNHDAGHGGNVPCSNGPSMEHNPDAGQQLGLPSGAHTANSSFKVKQKFVICIHCGCKYMQIAEESLGKMFLLYSEALQKPSHSLLQNLLTELFEISGITEMSLYLKFKTDFTPRAIDKIFSYIEKIIQCISPTKFGDQFFEYYHEKFEELEQYILEISVHIDDTISFERTGFNRSERVSHILQSIHNMEQSFIRAGVILGKIFHNLLTPFLSIDSLEEFVPKSEEAQPCPVCLDLKIKQDDNFTILSNCKHVFCDSCITQWLQQHWSCPMCRQPVSHRACRDEFLAFKEDQRVLQALHGVAGEDGASVRLSTVTPLVVLALTASLP
ncbi:uncharacterized protein LOC125178202 [Hyalella azteca]|uniref:Uncharacterized protein LOC125178202 n=1 Tax=Hyalella azteca TaxID=294128 RepID=A0A979FK30_HYAAZ|nr:uncharacterized protein LOC125178202 [Hyalella azteca]